MGSILKFVVVALVALMSAPAFADDSSQGELTGPIQISGFKRVRARDALHQISLELQTGVFESRTTVNPNSETKNLYLAFAISTRYARDCAASRLSVLCTFYQTSVRLTRNVEWTDLDSTDRYEVIAIPLEYVTGYFGKQGPELKSTQGALFATLGARIEFLSDLGLGIERRMLSALSAGLNYSSESNPLGAKSGFRWIGSLRAFGGCSTVGNAINTFCEGIAGGLESQIGLAFDINKGALAFTNTARIEGNVGIGSSDYRLSTNTNNIELKYSRPICRSTKRGGCKVPRLLSIGGGVRYEYNTASLESTNLGDQSPVVQDRTAHRVLLFGELARF